MTRRVATVVGCVASVACFACVFAPRLALAHHLAEDVGVLGLAPRTQVQAELLAGRFDLGGERGAWEVLALSAERTLSTRLSLAARLPLAHIRTDDGDTQTGVGDAEVGLRALLRKSEGSGLRLACGTGFELPTGNEDRAIGAGHVEWGTYLAGSSRASGVILSGVVSHRLSIEKNSESSAGGAGKWAPSPFVEHDPGTSGSAVHGSVIEPHTDHEIVASLAATRMAEPLFFSLGAEQIASLKSSSANTATLRAETGYLLPGHRRLLSAGIEFPVSGEHRFTWRLRGGIRWAL